MNDDSMITVLDNGYVRYVDHLGSDLRVCEVARLSFDKWDPSFEEYVQSRKPEKLIKYLAEHNHWTPFGHPQITVEIKLPIFVARQWMKSTTGIVYNEVSRRYVDDEPEFYYPEYWRGRPDGSIKQGSGQPIDDQDEVSRDYFFSVLKSVGCYNLLLSKGVAPEMARMVLPQSMYTKIAMTASLAACCRVINLRNKPDAQLEIQQYAEALRKIVVRWFPLSTRYLLK